MPRVYWLSFHQLRRRTRRCTALYTGRARTVFWSLFYNDMCGWYSILDVVLEPWYRFADGYIGYIGPVFTAFLISMMVIVIFLCYVIVVPYEWVRMSYLQIAAYLLTGHWLLVMTWFHYGLAWRVKAGSPRAAKSVGEYAEAASFCKHCIAPKPPRTHHCRICGRCVLKMDHHCPWLSQCVGHYNHRYFFLSMVYMCLGCLYICVGSFSCFHEHFYNERDIAPWCSVLYNSLPYAPYLCSLSDSPRLLRENILSSNESTGEVYLLYGVAASNSVQFIFIVSAAMVVGLFGLTAWHAMLISQGQTSIEQHINDGMERKMRREGKVRSIYNVGFNSNWQVFLGLDTPGRSAWRTLLLPVRVPPSGDGYSLLSFMSYSYRMISGVPYHYNLGFKSNWQVFRNIYNLGFKINWQVFLGLDTPGRSAWRTLLLPVRVPPSGDGYSLISFMPYSYRMANRPPVPAAHRNDNVQYMFDDIR